MERKGRRDILDRAPQGTIREFCSKERRVLTLAASDAPVIAAGRWAMTVVLVSLLFPFVALAASAQDEPGPTSWASFRNDNTLNGIATSTLPDKLTLLWKRPASDGIIATAAIVEDRVYVGCLNGELLCLQKKTGKEIWKYLSAKKEKPNTFIPGYQSSPAVTSKSVFVGDEDGIFHAVNRETGAKRWTFTTDAEIISSPVVFKNRVVFGSYDSSLYCLDQADGSAIWKFTAQDRINGSPALAGDYTFVTGCDQNMRVIDIKTGEETHSLAVERFMIASPSVVGDMLYVGTHEGDFLAIDWKQRQIVWTYRDPKREYPYHSSAAVKDDRIVVGGQDKQVHCIHRKTGERVWVFPTRGQVNSSPVIVGDRVFIGSNDGNLYQLKLDDGAVIWKFNAGRDISASPAVGEGCLVIGSEASDGLIYCFGAASDEAEE
jgi:eukaryotic-like serine/threonine-protein kinase